MQHNIIRVAVIGPESSGKSTLCDQLAKHFKTNWVHEYAREYITGIKRTYTKDDILLCAKKQIENEDKLILQSNKFIFSDTELIIAKVWLLDVFGDSPAWIENKIIERKYDLYLLTKPDLPFVADPVRENPLRRQYFYDWYKRELDERKFNYSIIEGSGEMRLRMGIEFIERL